MSVSVTPHSSSKRYQSALFLARRETSSPRTDANVRQSDFTSEASKARTLVAAGARQAEVFVNHDHLLFGPTELASSISEGVLASSGFTIVLDLAWCGLPNVHTGGPLQMCCFDFGGVSHWSSPAGWLARLGRGDVRGSRRRRVFVLRRTAPIG